MCFRRINGARDGELSHLWIPRCPSLALERTVGATPRTSGRGQAVPPLSKRWVVFVECSNPITQRLEERLTGEVR
jgi:hypothetical protein